MTAEVAVANRLAVALAADSAVTIGTGESAKIFQTENKLFELSKTKPVGVMIYNATDLFKIPLEIIIKEFRAEHGDDGYEKIVDWCTAFKKFLVEFVRPTKEQQDFLLFQIYESYFSDFLNDFTEDMGDILFSPKSAPVNRDTVSQHIGSLFSAKLEEHIEVVKIGNEKSPLSAKEVEDIFSVHRVAYEEIFGDRLEKLPLDQAQKDRLEDFAKAIIGTIRDDDRTVGIVFAGFGDKEIFPSLICIEIFGIFNGNLKCLTHENVDIDRDKNPGAIIPFAQRDAASSLLYGRSDEYDTEVHIFLRDVLSGYTDKISELTGFNLGDPKNREKVDEFLEAIQENFFSEFGSKMNQLFFSDVLDIVINMPKQELPAFAEALVNLTSIKRKVSYGPETVGGPIDVALISKHEGFVWIKRKHYFPPELNERYRWRQFGNSREREQRHARAKAKSGRP